MSNILLNRSFETGSIDNWTFLTGSVSKSSGQAYDGTYSCKITNPTTAYSGRGIESDQVAAVAGRGYTAGVWAYIEDTGSGIPSSSSATHIRMRMKFYDSSHNFLSYGYYNITYPDWGWTNITTWDAWLYHEFSFTAPASTAYISLLLEGREENNPSPPPSGQPDNNIYFDYAIIDEGALIYSEDDQRIVGAIGLHHDADDYRIYGYIMGPMPSNDSFRIYGLIVDHVETSNHLVVGEIIRRIEWLEDPDEYFLAEEDKKCNFPQKRVLFFHDSLPDNDREGPDGELKYVDLTDRVIQIGSIYRDMPSSPTDTPMLIVSDLTITVDNSDYYFSDRNSASPFKTILDDGESYVGWKGGGRVEVWCGFNYSSNVTKLIKKAKMVIMSVETNSNTGKATISLRDDCAYILDKLVGVPPSGSETERPLEYPTRNFGGPLEPSPYTYLDTDWIYFCTDRIFRDTHIMPSGSSIAGLVKVRMTLPEPTEVNALGKHTRAILMQEAMNKPFDLAVWTATGESGLVAGSTVPGEADESFTVTFDDETQKYKIATSGCTDLYFRMNPGLNCSYRWGWGGSTTHYVPGVTEYESDTVSPFTPADDTIDFPDLLTALLEDIGGFDPADVSIESLTSIVFYNVRWDNVSLLTAIGEVAQTGSGAMWMDDDGKIYFKTFPNMEPTVTKNLRGNENYRELIYVGRNAGTKIRKITVQGKFDGLVGEVDTGDDIGTEYNIQNNVIDNKTPGLSQDMANNYFAKYNVTPSSVKIKSEYLPSIQIADRVSVIEPSSTSPMLGQIIKITLDPSGFNSDIEISPVVMSHTWEGKEDWDDYVAPDGDLYVPHDLENLQTKLLTLTGYREYIFDSGAVDTTWINFVYDATLDSKIFFLDHFDYTGIGRYTIRTIAANYALGGVSYDAANYVMLVNSLGTDMSCFLFVDGLMDEAAGGYYDDYIISTAWSMLEVYGYPHVSEDLDEQAQEHYFGQTIRWKDALNFIFAFVKCTGGYSSPRLRGFLGGVQIELDQSYYNSTRANYAYLNTLEWYLQELAVSGMTGRQTIPGHIDHGPISWNGSIPAGPRLTGAGFVKSKGYISQMELRAPLAPDASDPVFEFSTSPDLSTWSVYTTDITAAGTDRYLKVKVTLSRPSKYHSVPNLNSMTVGYSI